MDKLEQHKVRSATIMDTTTLRSVLEARVQSNMDQIHRLALSAKPEDNCERLQLLGANREMIQILSQID